MEHNYTVTTFRQLTVLVTSLEKKIKKRKIFVENHFTDATFPQFTLISPQVGQIKRNLLHPAGAHMLYNAIPRYELIVTKGFAF